MNKMGRAARPEVVQVEDFLVVEAFRRACLVRVET
jgi:hypothetical protein